MPKADHTYNFMVQAFESLAECPYEQNGRRFRSGRRRCTDEEAPPCGILDPMECKFLPKRLRHSGKDLNSKCDIH